MSELCSKGSGSLSAGALLLQRGMRPGFSVTLVIEARGRSGRLWLPPIAKQKKAELTYDFSRQIECFFQCLRPAAATLVSAGVGEFFL